MSDELKLYPTNPREIFEMRVGDLAKYEADNPKFAYDFLDEGKLAFYRETLRLNRFLFEYTQSGVTKKFVKIRALKH